MEGLACFTSSIICPGFSKSEYLCFNSKGIQWLLNCEEYLLDLKTEIIYNIESIDHLYFMKYFTNNSEYAFGIPERIVYVLGYAALPGKEFNGTFMQEIDKQFYLVSDWVDGKSLKSNEINIVHCEKIGAILADIHMTNFSELGMINDLSDSPQLTDWNYYLQKGQENNAVWVNLLLEIINMLYEWNAQANKSVKQLESDMVISHRDLRAMVNSQYSYITNLLSSKIEL